MKLLELVVVMVACLSPIFFLASEVDGDEFAKSLIGVVQAGSIFGVIKGYQIWTKSKENEASA